MRGCVMAVAARALSAVASVAGATRSTVRQNVPISMIGKRRVAVVRGHLSCRARHVIASTSSSSRGSACGGFGSVSPAGLGGAASRGGASLSLGAPRADRRTDRGDSRGSIEAGAGASSSGGAAGGGPVDVGTSSSYPDYQPQVENYAGALACVPPDDASLTPGHVVLVDGMSVVFRAFYGLRNRADRLVNSKGEDVSVLFSVAHTVLGLLELQPTHMAVCFDAKGKTFRHEMFTDYKANRPPTPPELAEAIPAVTDMVQRMGIPLLMMSGVEADDIIGTVARRSVESGLHVSIMSPDKDFFQLLGPRVRQLRPNGKNFNPSRTLTNEEGGGDGFGSASHHNLNTKGLVPYTERDFRDEFMNLDPAQFVDLLAMVGDASDNVPGVEVRVTINRRRRFLRRTLNPRTDRRETPSIDLNAHLIGAVALVILNDTRRRSS